MTSTLRYSSGPVPAIAVDGLVLLVGLDPEDDRVDRLVEACEAEAPADEVLDVLVERGVRSMPDFALCHAVDGGFRLVFRGAFAVVADQDAVAQGSGPWSDTVVRAARVLLEVPDDAVAERWLPLRGGLVLAGAVLIGEGPAGASRVTSGPPPRASQVSPAPPTVAVAGPPPAAPADPPPAAPIGSGPGQSAGRSDADFDALFGATTARPEPPAPVEPAVPQPAEQLTLPPRASVADAGLTRPSPHTMEVSELPGVEAGAPVGGLITGAPWLTGTVEPAPMPPVPPVPHVQTVPIPPLVPAGPAEPPPSPDAAGRTVSRASLLAQQQPAQTVVATRCPQGHLTQAYGAVCRVCREPVSPQQHVEVPRPTLGLLRLSTGAVVTLDRGAILGRNPRVPSDFVGDQPNLVRVVDPEKGVSSQHLEVSLDYWNVNLRDLGSTNGTEVVLPGAMPMMLPKGASVILEPGSRVILGGTVSMVFEVTG